MHHGEEEASCELELLSLLCSLIGESTRVNIVSKDVNECKWCFMRCCSFLIGFVLNSRWLQLLLQLHGLAPFSSFYSLQS
jgi:hypothetical protein